MSIEAVNVQIPDDVRRAIQEIADRMGRSLFSVVNELLTEATKMRRVPGIIFADGPTGRRARIEGTGIEVFEVVRDYRAENEDWEGLRKAFHWLSEGQLRAALAYADLYPEEIEEHLRPDDQEAIEALWAACPATKPPWR